MGKRDSLMSYRREGHEGTQHETHHAGRQMVFIQDAVSRSKDSAQRRDLRFESGALLSSDRSLCDPDPAWDVSNKTTTQFSQRTAYPNGEGCLAPAGISHV